jgi:hypothetical protein
MRDFPYGDARFYDLWIEEKKHRLKARKDTRQGTKFIVDLFGRHLLLEIRWDTHRSANAINGPANTHYKSVLGNKPSNSANR